MWGAVKDKFYADNLGTIDALKDNIHEAIGEIQLHTIDNVLKNWTDPVGYCMASRGSNFNAIIFHYLPDGLYFQIKKEICANIFQKKKVIWLTLYFVQITQIISAD